LLGSRAVNLAFLWAINTTQADAFGVVVVQDLDGVAVEDGDDEDGGSHTPTETPPLQLKQMGTVTVVSVGKRLQCLSS
jgi:hypothetical protein